MSTVYFHQVLRAKITEHMNNEIERMISGDYKEYAVYREQVGYLRALRGVLEIAEEIERGMT